MRPITNRSRARMRRKKWRTVAVSHSFDFRWLNLAFAIIQRPRSLQEIQRYNTQNKSAMPTPCVNNKIGRVSRLEFQIVGQNLYTTPREGYVLNIFFLQYWSRFPRLIEEQSTQVCPSKWSTDTFPIIDVCVVFSHSNNVYIIRVLCHQNYDCNLFIIVQWVWFTFTNRLKNSATRFLLNSSDSEMSMRDKRFCMADLNAMTFCISGLSRK